MSLHEDAPLEEEDKPTEWLALAVLSCLVGGASGLLTALFRLTLEDAGRLRNVILGRAHEFGWWGLAGVIAISAAATALAALLVRRFAPHAKGSGIPHVEAVLRGEQRLAPPILVVIKFIGGVLSMGTGLALGREGPSVQMGASLASFVGMLFHRNRRDVLALLAAGAGSGLATAFNAPVAGSVFVLEELVRRFDLRHTMTTLGASACAIAVSRVLLGGEPDFEMKLFPIEDSSLVPAFVILGIVSGFLGVAYNAAILGALAVQDQLQKWPIELRAGAIGAGVGLLAWFAPKLVGGGDALTESALTTGGTLQSLALVMLLRFGLGAISYSAGTPGGLFAPLLVVGAESGVIFGILFAACFPESAPDPRIFGVVGMAAFFTAVVRAPVTGIVLITEMTANSTLLLPMLAACFSAMLIPTLLHCEPIYDSLREPADAPEGSARVAPKSPRLASKS